MGVIQYNQEKMGISMTSLKDLSIAVLGVGAVGSHLVSHIYQHGCGIDKGGLVLVDFDTVDGSNYTKQSGIVAASDVGKPKAAAIAAHVNDLVGHDDYAAALNMDITHIGPEFYSQFDAVFVCVDNFSARAAINRNIFMAKKRPIVITTGTGSKIAQAFAFDLTGACPRCLWNEDWLSNNTGVSSSCRAQYQREVDAGVTPTSKLLSSMAADLAFSQLVSVYNDAGSEALNSAQQLALSPKGVDHLFFRPIRRKTCPDHQLTAPADIRYLHGSVFSMTLQELMEQIRQDLGQTQFSVLGSKVVLKDYCPVCLKEKRLFIPAKWLRLSDITCEGCKGKQALSDTEIPNRDEVSGVFHYPEKEELSEKKLAELGFEYMGYITVMEHSFDFDEGKAGTVSYVLKEDGCYD